MADPSLYFAYGINMSREDMARRCPGASIVGVATLRDYRFLITDRGGASVIPFLGSVVFGVLWSIGETDLAALDHYEGVPDSYLRWNMDVLVDGDPVTAEIYTATSVKEGRPWPMYLERIVGAAREVGMPEGYVRELMGWGG